MFISKFSAFNYRSLKQVTIRLEKGKNVILGKNNSGKTNIIKGLEILIGEKYPTYQNITDNDFYTVENIDHETGEISETVAESFYLEAEISERDFDEAGIKSIKKKTAFSRVKGINSFYKKEKSGDILINYELFQNLEDIENNPDVVSLGVNKAGYEIKNKWFSPDELLSFLRGCVTLKVFFTKSRIDDEKSGFGIICIEESGEVWISNFFSKKLRDSLITSTVISALRSQKEDLRLVHYTWFGKLILGLWDKYKTNIHAETGKTYEDLIKEKSIDIKYLVDNVFEKDTKELRKLLEGAIAHKAVTFRFLNDTKNELYKNVQLFVNDGIDRPLYEKGTGIQSAIIISLFSMYCNNFHKNSSLLIAEEPELFLHPQARRVISAELDKFIGNSKEQPRQLIISTHSIEYLRNVEPYNIVRVYKNIKLNCSIAKQLNNEVSTQITAELKRFLWSNNSELFFADRAVLVEGGEVYLIPSIIDKIKDIKQLIDYKNISVIRVNGKGSFMTYIKMLECFDIEYVILGDLDCFKDEVKKFIKHLNISSIADSAELIKTAIASLPINYETINERIKDVDKNHDAQRLQTLLENFANGTIEKDNEDLLSSIQYMQSRHTKGDKVTAILNSIDPEEFDRVLAVLRDNKIFIWSKGELENYYTDKSLAIKGSKDMKALEISYLLLEDETEISELFLHIEEINLLVELVLIE
jgi:putative ATP-dependent endonuclease of the OLD family